LLDPVTGAAFLVGAAALLLAPSAWTDRLFMGGLLLGAVPSLLAVDGPHALPALGPPPFPSALPALPSLPPPHRLPPAPLAPVRALHADLFSREAATDGATWSAFSPVQTRMGAFTQKVAERSGVRDLPNVYLSEADLDHPVVSYLTHGLAVSTFGADGLVS